MTQTCFASNLLAETMQIGIFVYQDCNKFKRVVNTVSMKNVVCT